MPTDIQQLLVEVTKNTEFPPKVMSELILAFFHLQKNRRLLRPRNTVSVSDMYLLALSGNNDNKYSSQSPLIVDCSYRLCI